MEAGLVSQLRRDRLWDQGSGKPAFATPTREQCAAEMPALLAEIQSALFEEARERRDAAITRDITSFDELAAFFGEDKQFPGWAEVQWSRPTGEALDAVIDRLKALKLTFRNVPQGAAPADGPCLFTGAPAAERIYVARTY
jgi:prolyl-tRNA synthetase